VRRKRFSVEQIVGVLKQVEVGVTVVEVCRQAGITEQTYYRWKKQYAGLETDHVRQLKQLQEENALLKRLVAELSLDKTMLQDVLAKKIVKPSRRRPVVGYLRGVYRVSQGRACRVARVPLSPFGTRALRSQGRHFGCAFGKSHGSGFVTATAKSGCC
jgi:putative transposase